MGNFGFTQSDFTQGVARVINGCNLAKPKTHFMTLKEKIALRLKAKAAGVNLSKTRIDAIVARAEKGLTDESDDTAIDANLDAINELTPFKEIASLDDHERAKAKKIADEKEAKRLADIEAGKTPEPEPDPNESSTDKLLKVLLAKLEKQDQAIAAINGEKVATTRREQFIASMAGTSKEYQAKELKRFDRITFKDDEDFSGFLEDTKGDHEAAVQEEANAGMGVDRPVGGVGGGKTPAAPKVASAEVVDEILQNI